MGRLTETVKHLIIINAIFWIATIIIGEGGVFMNNLLALHFPYNELFKPWQILTHMFMHSHVFIPHILLNMLALYMFGSPLEQLWGRNKFLFFYFSSGLGAVLLPWAIDFFEFSSIVESLVENGFAKNEVIDTLKKGNYYPDWVDVIGEDGLRKMMSIFFQSGVGASGCIMGILVAFGMTFPEAKLMLIFLPIPIKAKYFIPLLLAYELISGLTGGTSILGVNIAHFAHVGGAVAGFIMMWYWKKNQFNKNRWD